jgi:hypothetical protein
MGSSSLEQIVEDGLPQYSNMRRLVESREASSSPEEHIKGSSNDRQGGDALRTVMPSPFLEQVRCDEYRVHDVCLSIKP